jgi:microcystin degradation protein MlrC
MRIAIGGIQTECSTYSRIRSTASNFRVLSGDEILHDQYFQFLNEFSATFLPCFFARAVPGGPVQRATYDLFKSEFLQRLENAARVDGLYLAMHGAMFVEGMQDAEGDWITAARQVVGDECLISASYDLHGNLSQRIIDNIDMLSAYRTAPHIDVEETMARSCRMLVRCIEDRVRPTLVWVPIPVLMPGERSSTVDEPARSLYAQLPEMNDKAGVLDASLLVGYVWADEPRATASAVLTGTDASGLIEQAESLGRQYWDAREKFQFGVPVGTISQCLDWTEQASTQPVILADSGDNPTGGGVGDRAEVLAELIRRGFTNALVAGIADEPATHACFAAGVGSKLELSIGGTLDPVGSDPALARAEVLFLYDSSDSREKQAVVRVGEITVVLTASRRPFHYLEDFSRLNLDPPRFKLLVVKSGYLSPELAPIANPNFMALSAGAINQDIEGLPENVFRPPTFPFNRVFSWQPVAHVSARSPHLTAR